MPKKERQLNLKMQTQKNRKQKRLYIGKKTCLIWISTHKIAAQLQYMAQKVEFRLTSEIQQQMPYWKPDWSTFVHAYSAVTGPAITEPRQNAGKQNFQAHLPIKAMIAAPRYMAPKPETCKVHDVGTSSPEKVGKIRSHRPL